MTQRMVVTAPGVAVPWVKLVLYTDELLSVVNFYKYLPCKKLNYYGRLRRILPWMPSFVATVLGVPLATFQFVPWPPIGALLPAVYLFFCVTLLVLVTLYPLHARLVCTVMWVFIWNTFLLLLRTVEIAQHATQLWCMLPAGTETATIYLFDDLGVLFRCLLHVSFCAVHQPGSWPSFPGLVGKHMVFWANGAFAVRINYGDVAECAVRLNPNSTPFGRNNAMETLSSGRWMHIPLLVLCG